MSQQIYILDILSETSMLDAHSYPSLYPLGCKLWKKNGILLDNQSRYRRLVGSLIYLTLTTPDITYAVQQLSQYMVVPTDKHWRIVFRVLKYLKGTQTMQLRFDKLETHILKTYCDSD